jgi:cytochrome c oxidase subunit 2
MSFRRYTMSKTTLLAAIGLLLAAAIWAQPAQESGTPSAGSQDAAQGPAVRLELTASKFQFSPNTIRVKAGTPVELYVTSTDAVHGLAIPGLNINRTLEQGKAVEIDFTPTKPGSYPFRCSVFCGPGHGDMKGELIVEE